MTVLYEVHTGHTKKVMKAFAKLYSENGNNNKKLMLKYGIAAMFFMMLPKAFELEGTWSYLCYALVVVIVLTAFKRDTLTYLNLIGKDIYYKYDIAITMEFGNSVFVVKDNKEHTYRYDEIDTLYSDGEMYFLHMNTDDVYVVPREDFVKGEPDAFANYLRLNTGKEFEKINLTVGERFDKYQAELREKKAKKKEAKAKRK